MSGNLIEGPLKVHKPLLERSLRSSADGCSGVPRSGAVASGRASYLAVMVESVVPGGSSQLERLLTVEDLSEYLGVPVRTLYDWRVDGRGPKALHAGRVLRYPETLVRAWVEENLDG